MAAGRIAATLLRAICARRAIRFAQALDNVEQAQQRTLARIACAAASTEYGRSLGLEPGQGIDGFRARVPVVDYAALSPWIERQRAEGGALITPGRTRCYEPTSGSSGAAKWIPYNDAMLAAFRSLFAIWAHDLLSGSLRPRSGRTFMSLSSALQEGGFQDDREYLGSLLRRLVGPFLIMPQRTQARNPQEFRDGLALALADSADLEIISIWSPGYLLVLLEHFENNRERLLPALAPRRRALFADAAIDWARAWPDLQLVSCWTEAAAAIPARRLQQLLPHATLQGKGLLATEAPLTLPLSGCGTCVPLADEIFLELEDDAGRLHLLHEATDGKYAVVVTQPGGLLRYRLGDRVRVAGRHRSAPLLHFAGRADAASDLAGEKLGEEMVAQALRELASNGFHTLLPLMPDSGTPYYCLLTDDTSPALAGALEARLLEAFRYREARALGQLGALRVIAGHGMRTAVHDALAACGIKAGDIKECVLLTSLEQARRLHAAIESAQRMPM